MKRILIYVIFLTITLVDIHGVRIDKLDYTLNASNFTATVVGGNPDQQGILTIPQYVTFNEKTYEVVEIGDHAFAGNQNIEWINFPPTIEVIGEGAFDGCKELWYYSWPGIATKKIKACAFRNCVNLQAFSFPRLLEELGGHALEGCESIGVLIFDGNFKEIPFQVCKNCTNLTEVVFFPGELWVSKKIRDQAFMGCSKLSLIIIAANIEKIYDEAFKGCVNLTNISSQTYNPCEFNKSAFEDYHYKQVNVEIYKGTSGLYKNVPYWEEFEVFKEVEPTGFTLPSSINNSKNTETFSLDGVRVNSNYRGIKIIKNADGKRLKVAY